MRDVRQVQKKLFWFSKNLEFIQDKMEDVFNDLCLKNAKLKGKWKNFTSIIYTQIFSKINSLNQKTILNLKIDVVKEINNETWKKCLQHLHILFEEKFSIKQNIIIERSHEKKSSSECRRRKSKTANVNYILIRTKLKSWKTQKNSRAPASLLTDIFVANPRI